jgi:hypothetical protein
MQFPFGFRRQAVNPAGRFVEFIQTRQEHLRVFPGDFLHGKAFEFVVGEFLGGFLSAAKACKMARVVAHDTLPFLLGDFIDAEIKVASYRDLVRTWLAGAAAEPRVAFRGSDKTLVFKKHRALESENK